MNLRFPTRFGTIALFFALTGCAVPSSQTTSSINQKSAVSKTAAAAKADDDKQQLSFDSALASMPAADSKDAKKSSLADAEPIDGKDVSDFRQTGRASWYGRDFHGRRTANGERFNMNALTAAHRTLPLSSYIKVTNSSTGKWGREGQRSRAVQAWPRARPVVCGCQDDRPRALRHGAREDRRAVAAGST
jgi:rare lipoprotein A